MRFDPFDPIEYFIFEETTREESDKDDIFGEEQDDFDEDFGDDDDNW